MMPSFIEALPKSWMHKATGQAVVTLNDRDHYLGPHGTKTSQRNTIGWSPSTCRPADPSSTARGSTM